MLLFPPYFPPYSPMHFLTSPTHTHHHHHHHHRQAIALPAILLPSSLSTTHASCDATQWQLPLPHLLLLPLTRLILPPSLLLLPLTRLILPPSLLLLPFTRLILRHAPTTCPTAPSS